MGYVPPDPYATIAELERDIWRQAVMRFIVLAAGLAFGAFLCVALISCGYRMANRADHPGVYVCRSPETGTSVYRLDTEDPETLYFVGDGGGVEFRDLNTGALIRLRQGQRGYVCALEAQE